MGDIRKKRVMVHTDAALAKTGFGRFCKSLMTYLYRTQKYLLVNYACGINDGNPELEKLPWRTRGALPNNPQEMEQINRDPGLARNAAYGGYMIDKIITEEKPDVYIAVNDPWAFSDYLYEKWWYGKIPCASWLTIDSIPLIPSLLEKASKIKNLWFWSTFGVDEMHKLGHGHVKCVHGCIDTTPFFRLSDVKRKEIRQRFNIPLDTWICGKISRNQLRKQYAEVIQGYSIWKKNNPTIKSALLFHCSFQEGWNIPRLAAELKVDKNEILVPQICRACREFEVKPFLGHDQDCRFCGSKKSQITTNVQVGVSEEQLNEIYNLMDVYIHAISSGGLEVTCVEAKLTELITCITNYSCGEELNQVGAFSLPLDFSFFREFGTEFLKSSTYPSSIAKQIDKVFRMSEAERRKWGKAAREWAIKNYSVEIIGKQIEEFLDSCEITNFDFSQPPIELKNPNAQIPQIEDNSAWIKTLYKEILKMEVNPVTDEGHRYWMSALAQGMKRAEIENYFRGVGQTENNKGQTNKTVTIQDLLIKNDKKHLLLVAKEAIGDLILITSLLKSWRESYSRDSWNIYFACDSQFFSVFDGNEHIDKVLPYQPFFESEIHCTGQGRTKGPFDAYCNIPVRSQRHLSYLTQNNINLNLEYAPS